MVSLKKLFRQALRLYSEQILLLVFSSAMAITYLSRPRIKGGETDRFDQILAVAALIWGAVMAVRFPVLSQNVFCHPTEALILSIIGMGLLVEAVRRAMGWASIVILGPVCLYALFSSHLTGPMQSRSIRWDRLLTFMVMCSASLAEAALYIAVAVVIPFPILAQLLFQTRGSTFFSDLSMAVSGRAGGDAEKIAIIGSALFGSVSGSAVSNVASTGAIAIPLMKDGGYRPKTAAEIEASASTGGQLMPPILGASAFLLAETLQVAYGEVVRTPRSRPFFFMRRSLSLQISRLGGGTSQRLILCASRPWRVRFRKAGSSWCRLRCFWAVFLLNLRPETAALYAVLALFLLSLVKTYEGGSIRVDALVDTVVKVGRSAIDVVPICAIAGIIIGLFSKSGLSSGMGFFLVKLEEGSLILLLLKAGVCILMGLGLPTVGVYLLFSTLATPPLIELGLTPMSAHLFVFYFGRLSMLTPPLAIAAFVAANMAKAPSMRTGFEAVRIAWPTFVVPFHFLSLTLLFDAPGWQVLATVISALAGVYSITGAVVGFAAVPLTPIWRISSLSPVW